MASDTPETIRCLMELIGFDTIKKLEDIIAIQSSHGNFDHSPYQFGLANGLLLAHAVVTEQPPKFLTAPARWISNDEN